MKRVEKKSNFLKDFFTKQAAALQKEIIEKTSETHQELEKIL